MKDWLKFFTGSFFLDKYALEGAGRRLVNAVLGLFLSFLFIYTGLTVGYRSSFKTHYNNCNDFKNAIYSVFANENENLRIEISTNKMKAKSRASGGEENATVINTFKSEVDAQKYGVGNFDIIVDTRPKETAYAEFTAYYVRKNGEEKITAEQYRKELSEAAKKEYVLNVENTGEILNFDENKLQDYKKFIESVCDKSSQEYNADIDKEYEKLKPLITDADNLLAIGATFANSLYELYVSAYYPGISDYDKYSAAPSVRSWYVKNVFENADEKSYFAVLDDIVVGTFTTDNGIYVNYSGCYLNMDGFKLSGNTAESARQLADEFVLKTFNGNKGLDIAIYFVNVLKLLPFIVIIILVLSLLVFAFAKIFKTDFGNKYGQTFKIISSYLFITSLLTFVAAIILSFCVPRGAAYSLTFLVFAVILTVRTLVLAIMQFYGEKKKNKELNNE